MCADKQFNVKKDEVAARLVAANKKAKENPGKSKASPKRVYNGGKG